MGSLIFYKIIQQKMKFPKLLKNNKEHVKEKDIKKESSLEKLDEFKHWYIDRYQSVSVQRNTLLVITFVCFALMIISLLFVVSVYSSKTFEPFIIEVDKKTGAILQIDRSSMKQATESDLLKRYFIVQYIRAREGYDYGTYRYDYFMLVRLLSSKAVYGIFSRNLQTGSSPINFGATTREEVRIKSITFLNQSGNMANNLQARIAVDEYKMPNYIIENTKDYVITMSFSFENLDLTLEERYINPFGFHVTSYNKVEEIY